MSGLNAYPPDLFAVFCFTVIATLLGAPLQSRDCCRQRPKSTVSLRCIVSQIIVHPVAGFSKRFCSVPLCQEALPFQLHPAPWSHFYSLLCPGFCGYFCSRRTFPHLPLEQFSCSPSSENAALKGRQDPWPLSVQPLFLPGGRTEGS